MKNRRLVPAAIEIRFGSPTRQIRRRERMSKIYATFSDPSLAERAAGALLDYGVNSDDVSLVRSGTEDDYSQWQSTRTSSTYGETAASGFETDRNIQGDPTYIAGLENTASGAYAPEASRPDAVVDPGVSQQYMDRSDPSYIYGNEASDRELTDPKYAATEQNAGADYAEVRAHEADDHEDLSAKSGISTTTPGDAGAGAAKGAGVGLGIGILAALASLFVPGFGIILGGGALATAIGGAVATTGAGAIAGGVTGYLKDQGVEETVAQNYEETLSHGGALLEVNLPSGDVEEETARQVLAKYGASNIGAYAGSSKGYVS
jgi:hypothetical protein